MRAGTKRKSHQMHEIMLNLKLHLPLTEADSEYFTIPLEHNSSLAKIAYDLLVF